MYQSGNIDSRPRTQHRASRGPLALKRKGRERARKGAANSLMFGSIYPKKQNSFVLDVAAAIKGRIDGGSRLIHAWAGSGRQSLLRSSPGTRYRDDGAEGLTSFRSTVLAPLISGRQMFVNALAIENEFRHHEVFQRLMSFPLIAFRPARHSIYTF